MGYERTQAWFALAPRVPLNPRLVLVPLDCLGGDTSSEPNRPSRTFIQTMSNFALLEPGPPGNLGAGVLKYNVGTPGLPLP